MPLATQMSPDGATVTIKIMERFDFNLHNDFRQAYEQVQHPHAKYIIDLQGTDYLDSSALGMLLLLREQRGGNNANIDIVHCRPEVEKILTIANFHQLFNIH